MAASSQFPNIFDDATRPEYKPSVIKSIMSKSHKRGYSADELMTTRKGLSKDRCAPSTSYLARGETYPTPSQLPLGEMAPNRDAPDGPQPFRRSTPKEESTELHPKKKSAMSLKSLRSYMDRKDQKSDDLHDDDSAEWKPKKVKSSTSLSAFLKLSQRSRKGEASKDSRDKENRSPVDLSDNAPSSPTWDRHAARPFSEQIGWPYSQGKRRTLEEEMSLYTPKGHSQAQQRNFYGYHQPVITRRTEAKPRPKSDIFSENQKIKDTLVSPTPSPDKPYSGKPASNISSRGRQRSRKLSAPEPQPENGKRQDSDPKRYSRVQAAILAFNAREEEAEMQKRSGPKNIDGDFEKLLDARNIPHNMRDKMRSLDTNIKVDFIQKDRVDSNTPRSASPGTSLNGSTGRRGRKKDQKDDRQPQDRKSSRSRSRSRGFSLSKGNISPRKRTDSGSSSKRRSWDMSPVGFRALKPSTSATSLTAAACVDTAADPSDFVHYLREIQKPEMVDVGKIHKLRILLRNETVSWVDSFIADGGMDEIVQLLYRIMKIVWREEHEDSLLHETLLCLKALCTTSVALKRLSCIESEFFPALLRMLFDEEKKGPSEFTTRGIIMNLLFTHLASAPSDGIAASRATGILSYLRDPVPPENSQPLSFIANIYRSRPYRVWCREVTNVSKEVFWIFLHHMNVVPVLGSDGGSTDSTRATFRQRHFPPPRPPVPAAPYVGGVEWDATNYLAVHLDLMNGLIASIPTVEERNQLRSDLRASGFEKVMGGSLRTCKEKFYFAIHDCLRTWVAAAAEDGWSYTHVREGPPQTGSGSPTKAAGGSPKKGPGRLDDKPPKLELPIPVGLNQDSPKDDNIGNWI